MKISWKSSQDESGNLGKGAKSPPARNASDNEIMENRPGSL